MSAVPTVRIADSRSDGGYRVINESDFDAATHTLYAEAAAVDDLQSAIAALADEPDAFTASGLPKTDRLSELLGRPVSADERTAAWLHYQSVSHGADA